MTADDGFFFGLGAFETIAIEHGVPQFLSWHLERLQEAAQFLGLPFTSKEIRDEIEKTLAAQAPFEGRMALKVTVTPENLLCVCRRNLYQEQDYRRGFRTVYSHVIRNETSPLTYHKTLNYGDCILEKRKAKQAGFDEPIFQNSKGALAEGATSNLFFLKEGTIVAPPLSCGMLPGIIRRYLYETYPVTEQVITPDDIADFDEMFLTNSLLGIMPVQQLEQHRFSSIDQGLELAHQFFSSNHNV